MLFVTKLSESESQALFDLTRHASGRVSMRALMVIWSSERVTVAKIARRLRCRPRTVRKWITRFAQGGVSALCDLPRSGRPHTFCSGTPPALVKQVLWTQIHQPPSVFGYVAAIWSVAALCQHLASRCGLQISRWKLRRLMRALGYRFTRPKHAPRRVDPERDRIHQQIGKRISEVKGEKAIIVEDETDIRLFPVLRRMWQLIGEQLRLIAPLHNEKRTIFGSIDVETGEVFHRTFERKRTQEMISFLADLLAHYRDRGLLLILDHASIHKSRALKEWLNEHIQIEVIYLPRYGGHLDNPVEKLWWHLKGYATANRCCRSMAALLQVVERYFAQLTPEKVFQLVG